MPYPKNSADELLQKYGGGVRIGRSAKHIENNQKYMMGYTWVLPGELLMF